MLASAAHAQARDHEWFPLFSSPVDTQVANPTLTLPTGAARTSAIALIAKGAPIGVTRIIVSYGNGQIHFEDSPISLHLGQRSRPIDQRDEALIVEAVKLSVHPDATRHPAVAIEIWGLKPAEIGRRKGPSEKGVVDPKRRHVEVPVFFGD